MQECIRNATSLTILFFDLDGLKRVNDTQGHEVGSKFLLDFSKLLRSTFRESDVIARVGGDEFAIIICCSEQEASTAIERLNQAIELENKQNNKTYRISYSVGKITLEPSEKDSPPFEALVAQADAAMYAQKLLKKSKPHLFIT
jgi:diguanylate cyclase (GGDEF)-like protein